MDKPASQPLPRVAAQSTKRSPLAQLARTWKVLYDPDPAGGLVFELKGKGSVAQRGSQWRLTIDGVDAEDWAPRADMSLVDALRQVQRRARVRVAAAPASTATAPLLHWLGSNGKSLVSLDLLAKGDATVGRALREGKLAPTWKVRWDAEPRGALVCELAGKVRVAQRGTMWMVEVLRGKQTIRLPRLGCSLVAVLVKAQEAASIRGPAARAAASQQRATPVAASPGPAPAPEPIPGLAELAAHVQRVAGLVEQAQVRPAALTGAPSPAPAVRRRQSPRKMTPDEQAKRAAARVRRPLAPPKRLPLSIPGTLPRGTKGRIKPGPVTSTPKHRSRTGVTAAPPPTEQTPLLQRLFRKKPR